jgi:deoxyribose-phosphate aldolase
VVGFPLGATLTAVKVEEARRVLELGAHEVDMVLNLGALKSGQHDAVRADIAAVVAVCRQQQALCKVILETCLLTPDEKISACQLCVAAGAHFVKTSTGFSTGGATVDDVRLLAAQVQAAGLGVKASGGIRTLAEARAMLAAGATRLGVSAGIKILAEARAAR